MASWPQSIAALQYRNFRLVWVGLLLSFAGTKMQDAALLWHVSVLVSPDRKALALGFVGFVRLVPVIAFSMVSGVIADAMDRKRVLLITQSLAGLVALTLAALTYRGLVVVWPIYVLSAIGAAVGSFDVPARQALVPVLVPREHLANAITLNSIMLQMASVAGPALAGLLIAEAGIASAYLFNALSFGFVIVALLMMRDLPPRVPSAAGGRDDMSLGAAMEGVRFVFRSPLIRSTMLLDFFATFFASATALLPIFAQDILHVGARGYGWLSAAPAAGSFITSVALVPATRHITRRGATIVWVVIGHGVATIVFGVSRSFWLTFACLALVGATDTVSTVLRNIIRHLETPDRLRGRMTGINMIFYRGGPELGEFEAGTVASVFGAPLSVISGGIGCLIATMWVAATTPCLRGYRTEDEVVRAS